jgi:hypothetical protein
MLGTSRPHHARDPKIYLTIWLWLHLNHCISRAIPVDLNHSEGHMKLVKPGLSCGASIFLLTAISAISTHQPAHAELHWQTPHKEQMRIRLIALATNYPRSSYFPNREVFVAAKQLGKEESRLIKLVYGYLPYQPPLSESGMDYALVHEIRAQRDPSCDETLAQMNYPQYVPDWPHPDQSWKYSTDSPVLDLQRRRATLPCYDTTAEDYGKSLHKSPKAGEEP